MNLSMSQRIKEIYYPYVGINSESGTAKEVQAGNYIHHFFENTPYFKAHPELFGSFVIEDDFYHRCVEWALLKGKGKKTIVLLQHSDVVEIGDYGLLKPLAFSPLELEQTLHKNADLLSPDARADLLSGRYIFGRGAADMKAGGAIQMATLEYQGSQDDFKGNILLIAVPDEENLSIGMRSAVSLLSNLKANYDLEYVLLINSEPHTRINDADGVISGGSIGKIMPFVYVRGILAHAGKSQQGFNPLSILGDVIRRTEMGLELADARTEAGEMTPLPTWLFARDGKETYDVSMPLSAFGCLNVLMYSNRPNEILQTIRQVCETSASETAEHINHAADVYNQVTGRRPRSKKWEPQVLSFEQYLKQLRTVCGDSFETSYRQINANNIAKLHQGEYTMISAAWAILDSLAEFSKAQQPEVVFGLVPPFYPTVSHLDRPEYSAAVQNVFSEIKSLALSKWGQTYSLEKYLGISDLSYSSLNMSKGVEEIISQNMPLYGSIYNIPFRQLGEISMPCINVGPGGKDFHKMTERVLKEDLFERTPELLLTAIRTALGW
jgi:arginine utilization protein RocB